MSIKILEFDLPSHWATALFYGDFCGDYITFEDRVRILHFQITNGISCCQGMDEEEVRIGISRYYWLVPSDYRKPTHEENYNHILNRRHSRAIRAAAH